MFALRTKADRDRTEGVGQRLILLKAGDSTTSVLGGKNGW